MKNLEKQKKGTEKGITLVALVVTIVVLLILAGITISTLFGENGIINKAQDAADATKNAQDTTAQGLQNLVDQMGEALGEAPKIKTKGKKVEGKNAIYTDETGTAVIPVGFCVVKDSTTDTSDKNTVASGLVISDVEDDDLDNSKKGNQFVWIPVPEETYEANFHLIEGYENNNLQTRLSAASNPSREAGASKTEIKPGKPNTANTVSGTDESVAMYQSVKDNHGFYLARFEAGIEGTTASTTTNDTNKQTQNGTIKPVSKKGVGVWNYIPWGGTTAVEASDNLPGNDSANGAVKVARSMYTKSETCGATSTLCYGVQWDATLNFIDSKYLTGSCEDGTFVKNSTNMGNYSGSIAVTGSNPAYQQKHIYDLAGNILEWTIEAYDTWSRVGRGGDYNYSGSNYPASSRDVYVPDCSSIVIGFRPALYL